MATGDAIERRNRNEDILETPQWIVHPVTGVLHLVTHKYHAQRLIADGGRVVSGPGMQVPVVATEDVLNAEIARLQQEIESMKHGSTLVDGLPNLKSEVTHSRPGRR